MAALLQALVGRLVYEEGAAGCIGIVGSEVSLDRASPTVGASRAAQAFAGRHQTWLKELPERDGLWTWLLDMDAESRSRLLAHCVALTVNALNGPSGRSDGGESGAQLTTALGLDMATWWRPTCANFFGRLTKAQILATVSHGVSKQAAQPLASLKKDVMAQEAERLLAGCVWLPPSLQPFDGSTQPE